MEIVKRTFATDKTVTKYLDTAFAWGATDCVRMAAFHVRQMGHKVTLVKAGSYYSELGAVRALKRAGFDTLEAAIDARFDRIPAASALVGDLIGMSSGGDWPALTVRLSNGRILGFSGDVCAVMQPKEFMCAWRVPCLR